MLPRVDYLLLNSGSGVAAISEELVANIQRERPDIELTCPFEGRAYVLTAFGQQKGIDTQTHLSKLIVKSPRENIRFAVLAVVLPASTSMCLGFDRDSNAGLYFSASRFFCPSISHRQLKAL